MIGELARSGITRKEYEIGVKRGHVHRYIEKILYVGMSELEFLNKIPIKEKQAMTEGPYLLERVDNKYVFMKEKVPGTK